MLMGTSEMQTLHTAAQIASHCGTAVSLSRNTDRMRVVAKSVLTHEYCLHVLAANCLSSQAKEKRVRGGSIIN